MSDRLPVYINPTSFSETGKKLVGVIKTKGLSRLSDVLVDDSGVVDIVFSFDKEGKAPVLEGKIKANLILQCQTCLRQVELFVDRKFKLGMVTSLQQADRLASDCEPLMLEDEKILLNELVADELLLALPDFPRHTNQCRIEDPVVLTKINHDEPLNPNNPFSILAKFKNTGE